MAPRILPLAVLLLAVSPLHATGPIGFGVNSDDATNAFQLVRIDLSSGQYTLLGPSGYVDVEGLAFAPDGVLFGIDDATGTLLRFNTQTGEAVPVDGRRNNLRLGNLVAWQVNLDFGLTFDCQGRLWASSDTQRLMWQLDPSDGRSSRTINIGRKITGLAARWDGLYGLGVEEDAGIWKIDPDTASATRILELPPLAFVDGGLDFDARGILWAIPEFTPLEPAGRPSPIFRIDVDRLSAEHVADTRPGIEGLAIAPPPCQPTAAVTAEPIPVGDARGLGLLALLLLLPGLLHPALRPR